MSDLIRTTTGVVLQRQETSEDTRTGQTTTEVWLGTQAECRAFRNFCRNRGATSTTLVTVPAGDRNEVHVTWPWGEQGFDAVPNPSIHELEIEVLQPSAYNSPVLRNQMPDKAIGIVATIVSEFEAGQYQTSPDPTSAALADVVKQLTAAGLSAYNMKGKALFNTVALRKTDSFVDYHYVYRRTITTNDPRTLRLSFTGAKKIWLTNEIVAFENIDYSKLNFVLPTTDYSFGLPFQWLKSPPHNVAVANQKTQIVYTYTQCLMASALLYEKYAGAQLLDV